MLLKKNTILMMIVLSLGTISLHSNAQYPNPSHRRHHPGDQSTGWADVKRQGAVKHQGDSVHHPYSLK